MEQIEAEHQRIEQSPQRHGSSCQLDVAAQIESLDQAIRIADRKRELSRRP